MIGFYLRKEGKGFIYLFPTLREYICLHLQKPVREDLLEAIADGQVEVGEVDKGGKKGPRLFWGHFSRFLNHGSHFPKTEFSQKDKSSTIDIDRKKVNLTMDKINNR